MDYFLTLLKTMKRIIYLIILLCASYNCIQAQERTVQNRPYTDLRPIHFGVIAGFHYQDIEFMNAGPITYTDENGIEQSSTITCDQDRWEPGFTVGVLAEFRLNESFQFRVAPTMYFGNHHLTFHNYTNKDSNGNDSYETQDLKTSYFATSFDLIFAAERFNNHRPYIMAGVVPMINLSGSDDAYMKLKGFDSFFEIGIGCDFYLPYFKLRPELKFMYGLTNAYDANHASQIRNKSMLPYTLSAREAHTKMVALTFYFE